MSSNMETLSREHFDRTASQYEKLTGGTTRRIAETFLNQLPKLHSSTRILDSACGPGIVTQLILEKAKEQGINPPPYILGIDYAPSMIDQFEAKKQALKWTTTESRVMSAETLNGLENDSFDAIIMNFGIFALPDAVKGASEMLRVLKPDGKAIVTTWKKSSPVVFLEEAIGNIRPEDKDKVWPISRDWMTKEKLQDVMTGGGFSMVQIEQVDSYWKNSNEDEFIEAMTGPFFQRLWKHWSEEEISRLPSELKKAMNDKERKTGKIEMIAWTCIAVKT